MWSWPSAVINSLFWNDFRGLFIINLECVLLQKIMSNLPVERSVDETLCLLKAFQVWAP
jgi:alkyl hydroperoxide reductase subunit AhpC